MTLTRYPDHLYCVTPRGVFQPTLRIPAEKLPSAVIMDLARSSCVFDPVQLSARIKDAFDRIRVSEDVEFRMLDELGRPVTRGLATRHTVRQVPVVISHLPGLGPNFHVTSHPQSMILFDELLELQPAVEEELGMLVLQAESSLKVWLSAHLPSLRARLFTEEWETVSRRVNSLLTSAAMARDTVFSCRAA